VKPTAVRVSNSNSLISSNSCSQVALKPVLNSSTPSKPVSGEIVTLFVIHINRQQFRGQYFALLFEISQVYIIFSHLCSHWVETFCCVCIIVWFWKKGFLIIQIASFLFIFYSYRQYVLTIQMVIFRSEIFSVNMQREPLFFSSDIAS